jgi:hypothetical protein
MPKNKTVKRKDGAIVALSAALNITTSHCHKLLRGGMPDGIAEAQAWRSARAAGDDSAQTLRRERILLVREQRERARIENEVRRGELIEAGVVKQGVIAIVSAAKGEFLKLASELPPQLCGESAPAIGKKLRAAIIGVLTTLSDSSNDAYGTTTSV